VLISARHTPAHTHDFNEVIGFIGSDPQNPQDFNGEAGNHQDRPEEEIGNDFIS
jgi:hypothetical protein